MENKLRTSQYWANSSFYTTKSGGITTVAQGSQQDDVRRSRIEHLPSYRRFDLSGKLQFVVVFQTIQIERLSLQIQSLRVMLKDSERQIRNYLNYEVQIQQLSENCHLLQQQRMRYQNELEKMSLACNSLYEELAENKKQNDYQVHEMKKQFQKSMNDLCKDSEQLTKTIRDLQAKLIQKTQKENQIQNNKKTISQEIVRLNQNMLESQMKINDLKQRQAAKTQQLEKCLAELKSWQKKANEQKSFRENNYNKLQNDFKEMNKKLNTVLQDKKKVINDLQSTNKKLNTVSQDKKKVISDLQNTNKKLRDAEQGKRSYENTINELKQNVNKQRESKDRVSRDFQNLGNQLAKQKREKQNLETTLSKTHKQVDSLTKQYKKVNDQNLDLNEKLKAINNLIQQQKQKSLDLQSHITNIKNLINTKIQQLSSIKQHLTHLSKQSQHTKQISSKLLQKTQQLSSTISQNQNLKTQLNKLNDQIFQLDDNLRSKQQYIQQLIYEKKSNEQIQKQYQNEMQQIQQMLNQQKNNVDLIKNQAKNKMNQWSVKYDNLQKENKKLLVQIEKIKKEGLIKDELRFQVDKLNRYCKQQECNLEMLNKDLNKAISTLKTVKSKYQQIKQIENSNTMLRQQLADSLGLNDQILEKVGSLYQEIESLYGENDRLREIIQEMNDKDDDFMTRSSKRTINNIKSNNSINPSPTQTAATTNKFGHGHTQSDYNMKFSTFQYKDSKPFTSTSSSKFDTNLAFNKLQRSNSPTFPSAFSNTQPANLGSFTERNNSFTTEINLSRLGKAHSILGELNDKKKILEPSASFVNRQSSYSGLGSFTARSSNYGLNRYQKK